MTSADKMIDERELMEKALALTKWLTAQAIDPRMKAVVLVTALAGDLVASAGHDRKRLDEGENIVKNMLRCRIRDMFEFEMNRKRTRQ